jgi:hypothetical protein
VMLVVMLLVSSQLLQMCFLFFPKLTLYSPLCVCVIGICNHCAGQFQKVRA